MSPAQYDIAIEAAARLQRKLIEAKVLENVGMLHRASARTDSAVAAFEALAAAMEIQLVEPDHEPGAASHSHSRAVDTMAHDRARM